MNDAELLSFCNEMIGKFKMLSDLQKEMQYELIDTKFTEWELKKLIFALDVLRTIADRPQGEWIPCSERLPEDIRPVLVTWKNTDPASYYQYIVGKHFIGTAHYCKGKWYWYSSVTEDLLAEYGKCESEEFDEAIEAVAWMPLPKPWKGADDETD